LISCSVRDAVTGRFVVGHKPIPERDPVTGCFISVAEYRYRCVRFEVDAFLLQFEQLKHGENMVEKKDILKKPFFKQVQVLVTDEQISGLKNLDVDEENYPVILHIALDEYLERHE